MRHANQHLGGNRLGIGGQTERIDVLLALVLESNID